MTVPFTLHTPYRVFAVGIAVAFGVFAAPLPSPAGAQEPAPPASVTDDERDIRRLIADHYVTAVFVTRDEAAVRLAFHPRFHLFVLDHDTLIVASLDTWLGRLKLDGIHSSKTMRHDVAFIDVAGNAAVARTELFEDGQHIYTDYFSLYRFPFGSWRIVTKTFQDRD